MRIDGINFNEQWAKSHTADEFVKEFMPHQHVCPGLSEKEKEKALRGYYKQLTTEEKKSENPGATTK